MIDFTQDGIYIIKPEHHDPSLIEFKPTTQHPPLAELQAGVGGWIEGVDLAELGFATEKGAFGPMFVPRGRRARGYLNEEGKLFGLAVNLLATHLVRDFGYIEDVIVGPMVVLTGKAQVESDEEDDGD